MVDYRADQGSNHLIYYPISPQQRFIEIMQCSDFLFQDDVLKNLAESLPNLDRQVKFFTNILSQCSMDNLDMVRKLSWVLSELYLEKSVATQAAININLAMFEVQ